MRNQETLSQEDNKIFLGAVAQGINSDKLLSLRQKVIQGKFNEGWTSENSTLEVIGRNNKLWREGLDINRLEYVRHLVNTGKISDQERGK